MQIDADSNHFIIIIIFFHNEKTLCTMTGSANIFGRLAKTNCATQFNETVQT